MCYNNYLSKNSPVKSGQVIHGFLLLGALLLACRISATPNSWPVFEPGSLLFQDDFSDPGSGWEHDPSGLNASLEYQDQAYRITAQGANQILWSGPGLAFADTRLEVDANHPGQAADDDFGFICRAQDRQNFYYLVVSSDGYYGIGKVVDGVNSLIGMDAMPPSESINQGQANNHLRADCFGNTLALYANRIQLASVRDDEFDRGEVGLMAGTLGAAETEVIFDNFSVFTP
jgi:hypothetical protein